MNIEREGVYGIVKSITLTAVLCKVRILRKKKCIKCPDSPSEMLPYEWKSRNGCLGDVGICVSQNGCVVRNARSAVGPATLHISGTLVKR